MLRYRIDQENIVHVTGDNRLIVKFPIRVLRQQKEGLIKCFKMEYREEVQELLYILSDELKEHGIIPM